MGDRKRLVSLILTGVMGMSGGGCIPRPSLPINSNSASPAAPFREPVRWIMVESRADGVYPGDVVGEGRVVPEAPLLTMVPLYREDLAWEVVVEPRDYFVEVLGVLPKGLATPGETVMVTVRVGGAKPGEHYRLAARPSQPEVTLVGEAERVVRGPAPAVFRFTSTSTGRGGIAVGVERIVPERLPPP